MREAYPQAHITALTSTTASDILRSSRDIDELLTFDRYRGSQTGGGIHSDHQPFRQNVFCGAQAIHDIAIDLQGSWKPSFFSGQRGAARRYAKGRWWFAEHFHQPTLHAIDEMGGVLALAGIRSNASVPLLDVDGHAARAVANLLHPSGNEEKPIALLLSAYPLADQNWPMSHFANLADRLSNEFQVVFSGSDEGSFSD